MTDTSVVLFRFCSEAWLIDSRHFGVEQRCSGHTRRHVAQSYNFTSPFFTLPYIKFLKLSIHLSSFILSLIQSFVLSSFVFVSSYPLSYAIYLSILSFDFLSYLIIIMSFPDFRAYSLDLPYYSWLTTRSRVLPLCYTCLSSPAHYHDDTTMLCFPLFSLPSFTLICLPLPSFNFICLRLPSFTFLHLRLPSFTFLSCPLLFLEWMSQFIRRHLEELVRKSVVGENDVWCDEWVRMVVDRWGWWWVGEDDGCWVEFNGALWMILSE